MIFPFRSSRLANCKATKAAAPDETPTNRPSFEANKRAVAMASSSDTVITSSTTAAL